MAGCDLRQDRQVGERRYWAGDVATIASRHATRLTGLLDNPSHAIAFAAFLGGLRASLNPGVTRGAAIQMLAQHLITKPLFDALFQDYAFTARNPVSIAMQAMLDALPDQSLEDETSGLEDFYASVRRRAEGIDNAAGKQKIVVELYE